MSIAHVVSLVSIVLAVVAYGFAQAAQRAVPQGAYSGAMLASMLLVALALFLLLTEGLRQR